MVSATRVPRRSSTTTSATAQQRTPSPLMPASFPITMDEYLEKENREFVVNASKDIAMKKLALTLLELYPEMWKPGGPMVAKKWQAFGAEMYRRTGKIYRCKDLHSVFTLTKSSIKRKLRTCILIKRMHRSKTDEEMWKYELYPYFQYYRQSIGQFEAKLRDEPWTGEDQAQEDDDILFDGLFEVENNFVHNGLPAMEEKVRFSANLHTDEQANMFDTQTENVDNMMGAYTDSFSQIRHETSKSPMNAQSINASIEYENVPVRQIDKTADNIGDQVKQLFVDHPDRANFFREVLFKTVLELRDPAFTNAGVFFDEMSSLESAKRRRRSEMNK
ncbi:Myb_DNA-bind_3 domain-containing protein [Caenorhabditis elegans]|uniref:Myb_DNA-bind_3 domain-containing protein n=1 Tax=Caenorhabditis elegans TaxID=6239 RepID=Q17810_CAEEL|nr:Myb_DNA-bind_3 domain-containing protein [Caenorhabditis elegans]CCD63616.1 Myb_DNA-bind_3 domain-containing protein [Caenorhabditis elegans]|eukprot:NP_510766.1 LIn-8 Domain containing [Caenorhabditis elegans]